MRVCFTLIGVLAFALRVSGAGEISRPRVTTVVRADPRTGKLVRSVVLTPGKTEARHAAKAAVARTAVPPAGAAPALKAIAPPPPIEQVVQQVAAKTELSPYLLHSVIKVESNYNPFAVSSKGALGLMQLIPATARRFGVSDVFDPVENIEGGARYLKYLLEIFHNDLQLALAAYNAGENAVARYGTVPPYAETRNYVQLVGAQMKKAEAAEVSRPKAEPAPADPNAPKHIQEIVEPGGMVRYVNR